MKHAGHLHGQFVFGDFVLTLDGTLLSAGKELAIPPKELSVLTALLEAPGELVSKGALLDRAWGTEEVSEESLTRCIYALRRLLNESKTHRYIDTVYGKGYRFSCPVNFIPTAGEPCPSCTVAVLPFCVAQLTQWDAAALHEELIHKLARLSHYGLAVLPAIITRDVTAPSQIFALLDSASPDYYVLGKALVRGASAQLKIELVRARDHALLSSDMLPLSLDDNQDSLIQRLAVRLPGLIPGFVPSYTLFGVSGSYDVMVSYLQARRYLRLRTRANLDHALHFFRMSLAADTAHAPSWCGLAETYIALATQGYIGCQPAISEARVAVANALSHDPHNPLALAVNGWLISFADGHTARAEQLFQQALLLLGTSAELHYYHACHLLHTHRLVEADAALRHCLVLDAGLHVAQVLQIWVLFNLERMPEALAAGEALFQRYPRAGPAAYAAMAVVYASIGEMDRAVELASLINAEQENALWLSLCHAWVFSFIDASAARQLVRLLNNAAGELPLMSRRILEPRQSISTGSLALVA